VLPGRPEPRQNVPCVRFKNSIESVNVACASYVPFWPDRCEIETKQWFWLSSRHLDVSGISVFEFSHSRIALLEDLWVCEFSTIYGNSRSSGVGIEQAMPVKDKLSRFRDALTLSALLLVLPAINSAQEANRLQLSPPALQGRAHRWRVSAGTAAAMRR